MMIGFFALLLALMLHFLAMAVAAVAATNVYRGHDDAGSLTVATLIALTITGPFVRFIAKKALENDS